MINNIDNICKFLSICCISAGLYLFTREINVFRKLKFDCNLEKHFCIFYSTETGNSRRISEILKEFLEDNNLKASIYEINSIFDENLQLNKNNVILIFVVSTYGNGNFPYSSCKFIRFLKSMIKINKKIFLEVKYTVVGLGSSIYGCDFNKAAISLDKYIRRLGGERYSSITKLDEISGNEKDLVLWWNNTFSGRIEKDIGINVQKITSVSNSTYENSIVCVLKNCEKQNLKYKGDCYTSDRYFGLSKFYIESRSILFKYEVDKACHKYAFNVKLNLDSNSKYQTHDIIDILPANQTSTLDFFSKKVLGIKDSNVLRNTIINFLPVNKESLDIEVPFPDSCTLEHALTYYFDLVTLPSQDSISQFFPYLNSNEIEFIANNNHYNDFKLKYKFTFMWFIENFMTSLVPVPIEKFVLFRGMRQRFRSYSISSSSLCSPSAVELTVSTYIEGPIHVDTTLPQIDGIKIKYFEGLCSNYLLVADESKPILGIIRPSNFELKTPTVPMLLFSHGSGIAPIRALLYERKFLLEKKRTRTHSYLFYGCKTSEHILYRDELEEFKNTETLTDIFLAFSKSENMRVKDLIKRKKEVIKEILDDHSSIIFICGSKNFSSALKREIATTISETYKNPKLFEGLYKEGRIYVETWN